MKLLLYPIVSLLLRLGKKWTKLNMEKFNICKILKNDDVTGLDSTSAKKHNGVKFFLKSKSHCKYFIGKKPTSIALCPLALFKFDNYIYSYLTHDGVISV